MKMRTYNPQLAELMSEIDKTPIIPTLRTFGDIVNALRNTHAILMVARDKFESIYSEAVRGGKYSSAGLRDMKEDFEETYKSVADKFIDLISGEIEKWKSQEQKNTYAIVSKAPTEEQARSLSVILTRENISQAEIELWAKSFGDNYACSCSFRDFAKNKGYLVIYSDFTDAEERIEIIEDAYQKLRDMLQNIKTPDNESYKLMVFYGMDNNTGEFFSGTWVDEYIRILDSDTTFKPQTIEIKPISDN
jgi:hypothetical protein